jgi:hypothetical protein
MREPRSGEAWRFPNPPRIEFEGGYFLDCLTVIISAIARGWTYQVSNRQASRLGVLWDGAWNKTIPVATGDAVFAMSFWRAACLGKASIDEWATGTTWCGSCHRSMTCT